MVGPQISTAAKTPTPMAQMLEASMSHYGLSHSMERGITTSQSGYFLLTPMEMVGVMRWRIHVARIRMTTPAFLKILMEMEFAIP